MFEANFLMRTLSGSVKANAQVGDEVSHALSLIWKYVVLVVDLCLQNQHKMFENLLKKFNIKVESTVGARMERYDREVLTFDQ